MVVGEALSEALRIGGRNISAASCREPASRLRIAIRSGEKSMIRTTNIFGIVAAIAAKSAASAEVVPTSREEIRNANR
jgi:hypothetical protein